jgi:DNA polymerase I-like protein with 3'-5' exonuclease and polymerase domains
MLRRQGKVVGFNAQYGGGAESVYLSVLEQIPEADFEDIAALHATFAEKHVGIREHWESTVAFAETHGYQYTRIMDRRIYYPPGFPLKPTETSNYPIQGTAADIANCSMVGKEEADFAQSMLGRLKKYFPKAWLAMHTYDSFDIIAPKAEAEAIDKMMDECMSGPWRIGKQHRRYRSDGKIGQRWSEV